MAAVCQGRSSPSLAIWYLGGTIACMAMTLRLSDEENRRLDELAAAEGRSKQDIVRMAVADRWVRHNREQRLSDAVDRALPRYQGLLDRLGTA